MTHANISADYGQWAFNGRAPVADQQTGPDFTGNREFSYYYSARKDVVDLAPRQVDSVLEVGCAAGATGELLRERGVSRRYGVEIRPELVEIARKSYTEVRAFDAETMDLDWLPKEGVDCIIYPDVLEHFRDPWSALKRHAGYIKPGGFVIASLPNVRYYKAVMDLVWKGDWNYREAGVLDFEHLRFFTLSGALNLIRYAGLEVKEIVRKRRGSTLLKTANLLGFGIFDEFLVKQYIILATKVQEQ